MAHSPRDRVGGIPIYPGMQGKVALVTGGSSGIGLTTAGAFARQGVKVVIASRREATAKTALKQLSTLGDVQWLSVDAADGKSAARLMESIMKHARPPRLCFQQWRQRWGAGSGCEDARGGVAQDDRWISDIGVLVHECRGNERAEHICDRQ